MIDRDTSTGLIGTKEPLLALKLSNNITDRAIVSPGERKNKGKREEHSDTQKENLPEYKFIRGVRRLGES